MKQALLLLAILFLLSTHAAEAARPEGQPNIVLIFVDDMGYGDLACYGNSKHKTPNIDRLAAEGQRWTSFYASGAVCVPSRRGLMTGRHPEFINGVRFVDIREQLMPSMLKTQGYATAILGKWHLAGYPKDFTQSPMHPLECGFDYHYGTPGSNDVPAPAGKTQTRALFDVTDKFTFQVPLIRGREIVEFPADQELFTQRYTHEAVNWITEHKNEPFFLYLAHNMTHAPVFSSGEFQGRSEGGPFGDAVEEVDWSVGQVMAALKEQGIEEQTLVIFTSDNGPWTMFGPHGGTAAPLQGEKGTSWEGGYRVPGIFRWPGKIKPGVIDDIGANLDLYATFAALSGGTEPKSESGYISKDLSGTLLRGEAGLRKTWFFSSGAIAYRSGKYKMHVSSKVRSSNPDTREREPVTTYERPLLFDLSNDIGERNNISDQHPEVVSRLLKELDAYQSRAGAGF